VSRRTFYDLFEDREECFLVAFDEAVARASHAVVAAWEAKGGWRERTRGALAALLAFLDEDPALARLCVVESLAAGPKALEHRTRVVEALVAAVDEGRAEVRGEQPSPLTADGVVGAVLAVIQQRILAGLDRPLGELLGGLMSIVVLPYLGRAAAQKELRRPAHPLLRRSAPVRRPDPLEGLEMRITYRTVRVLIAIADCEGANNRQVAAQAGISDQGQVSKLLTRLEHLGLIENRGEGPAKGAPNAWRLTGKGREVEQAIRVQTGG
jgi:AcrR family transcriptional regulator